MSDGIGTGFGRPGRYDSATPPHKGIIMTTTSRIVASIAAAAMLVAVRPTSVTAAPQTACAVISLAAVRAIVGAPVNVYEPGSHAPTVRGDHTISTCSYTMPSSARSVSFSLIWAPASELRAEYDAVLKRGGWLPRIKGDVLAMAFVMTGRSFDKPAAGKVLDAVVKSLH